jgi:hypothetical protein
MVDGCVFGFSIGFMETNAMFLNQSISTFLSESKAITAHLDGRTRQNLGLVEYLVTNVALYK